MKRGRCRTRGVKTLKGPDPQTASKGQRIVQGDASREKLQGVARHSAGAVDGAFGQQDDARSQGYLRRREACSTIVDAHSELGNRKRPGSRLQANLARTHETTVSALLPGTLNRKHPIDPALQAPSAGVWPPAPNDGQHVFQARTLQGPDQVKI